MAEHTPWTARPIEDYGWVVEEGEAAEPICIELLEKDARQIVREHNSHAPLLDACKLGLKHILAQCHPCNNSIDSCARTGCPVHKSGTTLDRAIADAERKGET